MPTETLLSIPEQKVLAAVKRLIIEKGYSPTVHEVQDAMGYTSNSVAWYHLVSLRDKGYVDWAEGKYRTLRVTKEQA